MLGLLGKLLALPVTLPAAGIRYCLEKVGDLAEAEMWDDEPIKEQLLLLSMRLEEGEIDEAEFRRQEAPLLVRFREIRERRREQLEQEIAARREEAAGEKGVIIEMPDEIR